MNEMNKATMTMVKNAITSQPNVEQHKTDGYYIKNDDVQIYALFASNRVDLWHDGNHVKALEVNQVKSMKDAMDKAKEIIKGVNNQLSVAVYSKDFDQNLLKLKNEIDTYNDKLSNKDLIAIESFKMALKESFKNKPEQASQAVNILAGKIAKVASGEINLPDAPTLKQQADISINLTKSSVQDRSL